MEISEVTKRLREALKVDKNALRADPDSMYYKGKVEILEYALRLLKQVDSRGRLPHACPTKHDTLDYLRQIKAELDKWQGEVASSDLSHDVWVAVMALANEAEETVKSVEASND